MSQKISLSTTTLILGLIIAVIASGIVSSVATQQFAPSTTTGPQAEGPAGPQGDQGLQGLPGIQGEQGPPGVGGLSIYSAVAYHSGYTDISETPFSLYSTTKVVPTDGVFLLLVTVTVATYGDSTGCTIGLGTSDGAIDLHSTFVGVLDGSGTQRRSFSATSSALVSVTAGTYEFHATAAKSSFWNAQQVDLNDIHFSLMFFETPST
jgi:hypothetical protein